MNSITDKIISETQRSEKAEREKSLGNRSSRQTKKENKAKNKKSSTNTVSGNQSKEKIKQDKKAIKQQKKAEKKEKKKIKSFIGRVLNDRQNRPLGLTILALFFAVPLDILRIIKNLILGLVVICLICGAIVCGIAYTKVKPIYDDYNKFATEAVDNCTVNTFKMEEATHIYDNKGNLLVRLHGDQDSAYLDYEDIPIDVVNAFIAVEDRSFWDNSGIDVKGLIRVGINAVKSSGNEVHGASTITQQLSRNIFLSHEVSLERKAKEMLISLKLTKKFAKEQIMEFYVNDICFANAFYGIESAANGYFDKSVRDLSLSQIAYLCAIPNSPEYYNPYKYPERALERRDKILKDMRELGYITEDEYKKAVAEKIKIKKPKYTFHNYLSTYAIDCATKYMMRKDGFKFKYEWKNDKEYKKYKEKYSVAYDSAKQELATGGYDVYTTLDQTVQKKMQKVLDKGLSFDKSKDVATKVYKLQGAVTVVDNSSGKVIAVVGGRSQKNDSKTYSLNRAYQSYRQPGSTIKPLVVYTPALMNGYTPDTIVYNIDVSAAKRKGAKVQAMRGQAMTLRNALEWSKNGVAWQVFDKLKPKKALKYMTKMQFSNICPSDYYDSAALGGLTYGVTTTEMAGAYSTLVNHGEYRETTCIDKILDRNKNNIYSDAATKQVYTTKAADTMVDMMTGVLTKGTASKLNWYSKTKQVAACKTGTTNRSKDGWLCGFTNYYTVAVWVGYDQPKELSNLYGATYPGQIWRDCQLTLNKNKKVKTKFARYKSGDEDDLDSFDFSETDTLPSEAYKKYLPGRSDTEVLSPGYTVEDYRKDRVLGESVDAVIDYMNQLPKDSPTYDSDLVTLYNQGKQVVDKIYSVKYTSEMLGKLNSAYYSLQ